ncbi:MAG: glycosyltransferase family 4 protein [Desulfobacter sp.]
MHIVFIAHFAGSPQHGMVFGHYYLAREWVRSGHHVTIIAAAFAHTRFRQPHVTRQIVEEHIDGVRFLWIPTPTYTPSDRVGRVRNILTFVKRVWTKNLPIQKADLVIASSHHPFAIHPSRYLANRMNARLVFEVRDLWPLTLIELGGASTKNPFIRLMQYSEDYAYQHADHVVSVLPAAKDYMIMHGMRPDKFTYIPNGVDLDEVVQSEPLPGEYVDLIEGLRSKGKFLVGYAGRIGLANALHTLVDAVKLCSSDNVNIVIMGEGSHVSELQSQAKKNGVANKIHFLTSVPKPQVHDFLTRMDCVYIGLQSQPLFRFGVSPTKLNDYMLSAKPIIYAINTPHNEVEESRAGITCQAEDALDIAKAISVMCTMSKNELVDMGRCGYDWIIKNKNYRVLAERFLKVLT